MKALIEVAILLLTCLGAGSILVALGEYAASYKKRLRAESLTLGGELEDPCTAQ